jgi:hypothetical protein
MILINLLEFKQNHLIRIYYYQELTFIYLQDFIIHLVMQIIKMILINLLEFKQNHLIRIYYYQELTIYLSSRFYYSSCKANN